MELWRFRIKNATPFDKGRTIGQGLTAIVAALNPLSRRRSAQIISEFFDVDAQSRLPQDINVNPTAPRALPTNRPIGTSQTQNAAAQAEVRRLQAQGFTDIRVNQQQVNGAGQRVGINRPDISATSPQGRRVNIELDRSTSNRGPVHATRTRANDPDAEIILRTVD